MVYYCTNLNVIPPQELFTRGTDVEEWIQEFMTYMNVNGITSNKKEILITHMDKTCRTLMRAHQYSGDDNYAFAEAIDLMRKLF